MAGRYATALFELALENKAVDAVKKDLESFDAMVAGSDDLNRLVRSPVFGADEQLKALSAILAKAGIKGIAANFLRVITANRRLFAVRGMIVKVGSTMIDSSLKTKLNRLKSVMKEA